MTADSGNFSSNERPVLSRMTMFDKLPKRVRQALASADHNWSGDQLRRAYRRKHPQCRTAKACIEFIRYADQIKHIEDAALGLVCPGQR